MANNYTRNPIYIDTWSSDFSIVTTPVTVTKIRLLSAADGDDLVLTDKFGNKVFHMSNTVGNGDMVDVDFLGGFTFQEGLQCVVASCTGLGSGDLAWIYLE